MAPPAPPDPKLIESLPPGLWKLIPAATPPDGVKPNFEHPASLVPAILGVGTAFLALACFCYFIRIYTNLVVTKKWNWDDLTITLGFMCSIVYFAFVILGCTRGSGGRHLWDLHIDKVLTRPTLLQSYVTTVIVTPALGLIKGSLFIQYYLLFRPLRYVRISVYIGGTLSTVFYIVTTVVAFVLNTPHPHETFLEDILSAHYAKFQKFSIPTGVIGMSVDWCLFFLPMPAVYSLHLSLAKKFGVMLVFMTGGLAAVASTVALYYRVRLQQDPIDQQWKAGYIFIWSTIEMFAGVAAASMPAVKRFFTNQHFSPSTWGSSFKTSLANLLGSTRNRSSPTKSNNSDSSNGSYLLKNLPKAKTRFNDFSITSQGDMRKGSDSHIKLTKDVFVTREHTEDLTLSRW